MKFRHQLELVDTLVEVSDEPRPMDKLPPVELARALEVEAGFAIGQNIGCPCENRFVTTYIVITVYW